MNPPRLIIAVEAFDNGKSRLRVRILSASSLLAFSSTVDSSVISSGGAAGAGSDSVLSALQYTQIPSVPLNKDSACKLLQTAH